MTTIIVAAAVGFLLGLALGVGYMGRNSITETKKQTAVLQQIADLQLNPRTRIARAEMRSGPVTQEKVLERLGRASATRRVVVGGDPDSPQHEQLSRKVEEPSDG